ncbi:MAG: CoB--CoM heterodisulfide reductase iron-sulfur subunit A family protein [Planctomycetes bacterium]|nr:CoB--CoM heterodisulfide reductase iron-sulfur subunit A family protein [Planctomycetota bacterium]
MLKRALVIGGGIAGIQASLDLAEAVTEVFLLERRPSIGGRMAQLDKTFPTNDCAMCILSPKLVEVSKHPNIHLLTHAELLGLEGDAPDFTARIRKHPRYVTEAKCTGCGICTTKCPVRLPDPHNKGLSKTRCIRIPFPQAVPAVPIIEASHCIYLTRGKCGVCKKLCQADAIDYEQQPEDLALEVGAVVLALGSEEFEATLKDEYGYHTFPNVVTSIELERLLSASGPTQGHVQRPSDNKEPARVAFIQCVGSRDMQIGNDYCSAICCMQAAKDAIILTEHLHGVESTVFCMDVRAYGKGFDRFVERAKAEHDVRFLRARVSSVEADPESDDLVVRYNSEDGRLLTETFDLLVLSVGMCASEGVRQTVRRLRLKTDDCGFVTTAAFNPLESSRRGVFVCGTASGPKDIPESVIQASGASAQALAFLGPCQSAISNQQSAIVTPIELRGAPTRIGAFVCRCGINIASTVDVPAVVQYASTLPKVVHAQEFLFACSKDSQKAIAQVIQDKRLTRVVVAACTPRTHEPLFQGTLDACGLNPYLFEFANIREHCSWVHQRAPERATEKAKQLVRMGVAKAARLEPLEKSKLGVNHAALVIGGGAAGLTAALDLAAQGYPVHLVEREAELGGHLRKVRRTLDGEATDAFLKNLVEQVEANDRITVHLGKTVESVSGYVGNFKTQLAGEAAPIEHGVVIVATGAKERVPNEYLYGADRRVMTQTDFEAFLADGHFPLSLWERVGVRDAGTGAAPGPGALTLPSPKGRGPTVVMIQCVGSRDTEHPYCSRICCGTAIKNALHLKELNPKARVYVLCRDVRVYGLNERWYRQAREKGVVFLRYDDAAKPSVAAENGRLVVQAKDDILGRTLALDADLVVLSAGIEPHEDNRTLSQHLKVPLDADGFFLEAHVKLRPVDFATEGVFVCGLAHYPKDIGESIAQAHAAASRAATVLSKSEIEAEGKVAAVDVTRCSGCGACVAVCAYKALDLDPVFRVAMVNEATCKGCGTCAATCRAGAIDLKGFRNDQILEAVNAIG